MPLKRMERKSDSGKTERSTVSDSGKTERSTVFFVFCAVNEIYGINSCQFAEKEINDFQLKIQNPK